MTRVRTHYNIVLSFIKRHWRKSLLSLCLLVALFNGLVWLALGLLFLFGIYKAMLCGIALIPYKLVRRPLKGFFLFLFVFTIGIGLKLLVMDIYRIPSSSMENTLYPEDVILVNKLAYGPKLPQSPLEISWVNLLFYLNDGARAATNKNWWPYRRLGGSGPMEQGDLLVFQLRRTLFVVKRCVAVAGDTIKVQQGEVYTNGHRYVSPTNGTEHLPTSSK